MATKSKFKRLQTAAVLGEISPKLERVLSQLERERRISTRRAAKESLQLTAQYYTANRAEVITADNSFHMIRSTKRGKHSKPHA